MDLFNLWNFNKIDRSEQNFEINDSNTGYHAKGKKQEIKGNGFGISFSFTGEFISESDPNGKFPLLGFSFDDILSLNSSKPKSRKAIGIEKNLSEAKDKNENDDTHKTLFGRMLNWF